MSREIVSSASTSLVTNVTVSRPALSWCSKCGQSMEISSESILYKSKTNFKFRKIFDFDNSEVLIKTFSCALVDDILFQGTFYTSQNYFCFFSRIANKHKRIIISISQIIDITKEKTAGIFPNAIAIKTEHKRHLFASFVYRDVAFRCLKEIWSTHRAEKFTPKWHPVNDSLNNFHRENFSSDITEQSDTNVTKAKNHQRVKTPRSKDLKSVSSKSRSDFSSTSAPGNAFKFVPKDHFTIVMAILLIILLIIYIILLAWRINNLQLTFLEKILNSKLAADDILCPASESDCGDYVESVTRHQSQMTKVQSDLKETLTLLKTVVKVSGHMFRKFQERSMPNILIENEAVDDKGSE